MTRAWARPVIIIAAVTILLTLNAREFKGKRQALEDKFPVTATDAATRQQVFQAQTIEQLLHMIHTMLAAILVALLWA
jgi:hypothetical protein